jgi:hypothetical protein
MTELYGYMGGLHGGLGYRLYGRVIWRTGLSGRSGCYLGRLDYHEGGLSYMGGLYGGLG